MPTFQLNKEVYLDKCNNCSGGNTGLEPCEKDCNGIWGGYALEDN